MHEVPVHVNATMEEEVGQAIDSKGSSALSEVGWAVDGERVSHKASMTHPRSIGLLLGYHPTARVLIRHSAS